MTKELEQKYKNNALKSIEKFYIIYDKLERGLYPQKHVEEQYRKAMLEAMNVMMLKTLKELED